MYNYYDYDDDFYEDEYNPSDELYHFGVKGMKWGVRRYQNPDGSPTAAGRGRYGGGVRGHLRRNWKKYAAGAAGVAGLAGAGYLAYRNRNAIGNNMRAVGDTIRRSGAYRTVSGGVGRAGRFVGGRVGKITNGVRQNRTLQTFGAIGRAGGSAVGRGIRGAWNGARSGISNFRNRGAGQLAGTFARATARRNPAATPMAARTASIVRDRGGMAPVLSTARKYGSAAGRVARSAVRRRARMR